MNILIAGGTGFIGKALCNYFLQQGHNITIRTRHVESVDKKFKVTSSLNNIGVTEQFDVAINLAGEPIANKRWSTKQKQRIRKSRLQVTQEFITFFKETQHTPTVFISSSAIGYYGIGQEDMQINENHPGDDSFSSNLCCQWETLALQAESLGIRTCIMRTAIVLGKDGGALEKMLPAFKMGLGGKIGTGKQWMPWIHISDMVKVIDYCTTNTSVRGAINCAAPNPVNNSEFTKALAHVLERPALLNVPRWVITLMFGQMGKELLLCGKKVVPLKLQSLGFTFEYEQLAPALIEILMDKK